MSETLTPFTITFDGSGTGGITLGGSLSAMAVLYWNHRASSINMPNGTVTLNAANTFTGGICDQRRYADPG